MFWASGALSNHDCMYWDQAKTATGSQNNFWDTIASCRKILSPVARQAPTKVLPTQRCTSFSLHVVVLLHLNFGSELIVIWKRWFEDCSLQSDSGHPFSSPLSKNSRNTVYKLRLANVLGRINGDLKTVIWDCSLQSDSEHPIFSPLSKNSRNTQEDRNGEKLTVNKWWIFGADFSRFTRSFSRFVRDINGEKKHLVADDLFHG